MPRDIRSASDGAGGIAALRHPGLQAPQGRYLAKERLAPARGRRDGSEVHGVRLGKDITIGSLKEQGFTTILLGLGAPKRRGDWTLKGWTPRMSWHGR
ncbi:MAG: hypothetical protein MZU91_13080 [Desulfosudis oleivorans]|nr:hypothetical protein [Desulfosudis oleivorans]